jgi:hypothetical protein
MSKFSEIPVNGFFKANGVTYQKIDELYYIEPDQPDLEHMINPMFDQTIGEKVVQAGEVDCTAKFTVDPNTRMIKPNPNYKENNAVDAFAELWGSGFFDCGPEEYQYMVDACLALIASVQGIVAKIDEQPAKKAAKKTKKPVKKAAVKKPVKKTVKKAVKKTVKKAAKKGR